MACPPRLRTKYIGRRRPSPPVPGMTELGDRRQGFVEPRKGLPILLRVVNAVDQVMWPRIVGGCRSVNGAVESSLLTCAVAGLATYAGNCTPPPGKCAVIQELKTAAQGGQLQGSRRNCSNIFAKGPIGR
jgi:hypothetical protein